MSLHKQERESSQSKFRPKIRQKFAATQATVAGKV